MLKCYLMMIGIIYALTLNDKKYIKNDKKTQNRKMQKKEILSIILR